MRVLIVGRGVVGTIYGWALSKAGIDVTHVVRKEGLPATDTLDLLDLRTGCPKHTQAIYAPKTVGQLSRSDGFDLVIVATKHYQAVQAIQHYLPDVPRATILLFTGNWDGTAEIDRILPRSVAATKTRWDAVRADKAQQEKAAAKRPAKKRVAERTTVKKAPLKKLAQHKQRHKLVLSRVCFRSGERKSSPYGAIESFPPRTADRSNGPPIALRPMSSFSHRSL
jgi:ketopantoate reductase